MINESLWKIEVIMSLKVLSTPSRNICILIEDSDRPKVLSEPQQ